MAFLILGLVLFAAKLAGWGPVGEWSWLWVLSPFAAAVAWWAFADGSGLTQRRAMNKMEDRKRERRDKAMAALGLPVPGASRPGASSPRGRSSASSPAAPSATPSASPPTPDAASRRDPRP